MAADDTVLGWQVEQYLSATVQSEDSPKTKACHRSLLGIDLRSSRHEFIVGEFTCEN